ncbi:helix-turn-helix domain-containing protein [Amaricoccus solimangrovi]|uniref:Helix-turn-helix domain-containing protein n=1 Tax=Amaricoccus solimangrovi TaxID=2589815 RepID=A0A501WNN2_9RHOB|nr:helix-turn-helix domain-containing protein [Amaricoccus solimangrovi]TPE49950.1 helix-turn-helix domain-containing protein [Amaricoccus solimangrovi]
MTQRRALEFVPRLLPAPEAARYLGVSETMLRTLGIARRMLGAKRLYDRIDLDAYASALPVEGEVETNTCDGKFGVRR